MEAEYLGAGLEMQEERVETTSLREQRLKQNLYTDNVSALSVKQSLFSRQNSYQHEIRQNTRPQSATQH